jgi:hypothetical protein
MITKTATDGLIVPDLEYRGFMIQWEPSLWTGLYEVTVHAPGYFAVFSTKSADESIAKAKTHVDKCLDTDKT